MWAGFFSFFPDELLETTDRGDSVVLYIGSRLGRFGSRLFLFANVYIISVHPLFSLFGFCWRHVCFFLSMLAAEFLDHAMTLGEVAGVFLFGAG